MATAPSKIPVTSVGKNLERRVEAACGAGSAGIFQLSKVETGRRGSIRLRLDARHRSALCSYLDHPAVCWTKR